MADSIIKSFLVAIGYKHDEESLKKFESGVAKATKAVFGLAATIEATALAVAIGVDRFANNLERLYFATKRTGESANSLKAFDLAMQNFGASAGDGLEAVESLASFMRTNPGAEGLLRAWGVQTRDLNGNLMGSEQILLSFRKAMEGKPFWYTQQRASMLGLSEVETMALMNGSFERELARVNAEMKNTNWQKIAEDSHRFEMQMRDLKLELTAFGAEVMDAIQNRLGFSLKDLSGWIETHGPAMAKKIADMAVTIIEWAERIAKSFAAIIAKFEEWDKKSGGWLAKILEILVALRFLGGASLVSGILSLTGGLIRLSAALIGVASVGTGSGLIALLARAGGIAGLVASAGTGLGWLFDKIFPDNWLAKFGEKLGGLMFEGTHKSDEAISSFTSMGWTKEQAAGIVANLVAESNLNPRATVVDTDGKPHRGIAQWNPDRWSDLEKWAAGYKLDPLKLETQEGFVNFEARSKPQLMALMKAAKNDAYLSGSNFSNLYERPRGGDDTASERGAGAVTLIQHNTYHIDGADEPSAVVREANAQQRRQVEELTRQVQTAVQ